MGCDDCGFCLIGVTHCFYEYEVASGLISGFYYFRENADSLIECQIAHGFKELARRTNVDGDVCIVFAACFFSGFLTEPDGRCHDLRYIIELESVGTESVSIYDI